MNAPRSIAVVSLLFAASAVITSACGGDETGTTSAATTSTTGSSTTSGTPGGTGGSGGAGGEGSVGGSGGAGGAGGGAGGSGGAGGGSADCDNIPDGPFVPELAIDVFNGSEDIAFNGKGQIAGKDNQAVVLADAMSMTTQLAANVPTAYGLRYRMDGALIVALPQANKLIEINAQGMATDLATNLQGPNGVYGDFDGNIWFTEISGDRVSRVNPDKSVDVIVSGQAANSANGVVYDAGRKLLFYTNYGEGRIRSVDMSGAMPGMPKEVIQINDTSPDGLVMDACGHIYVVDQAAGDVYRVKLDAAGAAVGQEELIAELPQNVANAQFGSGPGWDPKTLYAAGNPGAVYAIPVGVPGAPVPTPP